jgi:hypothetical protein
MKITGVEPKSESNEVQCWGENPNAQMLRVELRDGSLHCYPYGWLERVQFSPEEKADSVMLFFNRQKVRIAGNKLRELALTFQRMAVEWVKECPERFASIRGADTAFIEDIQILEETTSPVGQLGLPAVCFISIIRVNSVS